MNQPPLAPNPADITTALVSTTPEVIRHYHARLAAHAELETQRGRFARRIGNRAGIPQDAGLRCLEDEDGRVLGLALPGHHSERTGPALPTTTGWVWEANLRALTPDPDHHKTKELRDTMRKLSGHTIPERLETLGIPERLITRGEPRFVQARVLLAPIVSGGRMALWQGWPAGISETHVRRNQLARKTAWGFREAWPEQASDHRA